MSEFKQCSWVYSWAKKTARNFGKLDSISAEDREQEILSCFLQNKERIAEIEVEQGEFEAKAYLGRIVTNHLKNANANSSTQLSGMNGATRDSDSEEVKAYKLAAMSGGISLQQELGEDGEYADIIPAVSMAVEDEIDYDSFFESCGLLAPLLMGKVDHPVEWCKMFPQAAELLTETPALRQMAVMREAKKCAALGLDPEVITELVLEYLDKWRGARGEYGDGDWEGASEASFEPSPELAGYFGEGSAFGAIALCKPLEEVPGYVPGFSGCLLEQVKKEASSLVSQLSIADPEGFIDSCVNRARSYLKVNGGLVKYNAVMERQQQDLFT